MSKKLIKSGLIVSFMTLLSRILGLVRDVVVANFMGAGTASDVFFFANKIPNFLRRLFAEGAFAQAFVPVLTEVQAEKDEEKLRYFIANVSGTLGVIVTVVTLVGVIASPILVALFGTGWFLDYWQGGEDAEKFSMAATMLKITFPYLWFVTLVGLSGAILNTMNRFGIAAFTPVLLNVSIITCAIYLSALFEQPAYALAWGVFFGGVAQLLFMLPYLWRAGVLVRPRWAWSDPKVVKVKKLIIPALFGVSVGQINLLLDTVIATFLIEGSISWLYYSDRLLEFPLGLFGIAIATVILPTLSRDFVASEKQNFQSNIEWGVKMVVLLGMPAAIGLALLAEPMVLVLFQRGEFTLSHAEFTSFSLMAYSAGLLSFMLVKVLAPGFYSRQDTKTPVRYGIWCMISNMVFNLIFVLSIGYQYGYIGLAMATSLSAFVNVVLLYQKLHRDNIFKVTSSTMFFVLRVLIATMVMAAGILHFAPPIEVWRDSEFQWQVMHLGLSILSAGLAYMSVLLLLGVRMNDLKSKASRS